MCLKWRAADNQCAKCSGGGGGPIQIKRKCRMKYTCDYSIDEEKGTMDCVTYCGKFIELIIIVSQCRNGL